MELESIIWLGVS